MLNFKSIYRVFRYESKWRKHLKTISGNEVLRDVMTRGYHVIPDFWNADQCKDARAELDRLLQMSDVKVWSDQLEADRRIMGTNNLSNKLDLFSNTIVADYITQLYGKSDLYGFSMGGKIENLKGNLGSGQGWHRDSAVNYQFKAILYLSDVNTNNGPFQYLEGSGSGRALLTIENSVGLDLENTRLTEEQASKLQQRYPLQELCAKAGTLILANTRGIHRGKPLEVGGRYALTNYYWPHEVPRHIAKFVNA